MVQKFLGIEVDKAARESRKAIDLCRAFIIASEVQGSENELNYLDSFASMIGIMAQAEFIASHLEPHEIFDRNRFEALATEADNMANKLKSKFLFVRKQVEAAPAEMEERKPKVTHLSSNNKTAPETKPVQGRNWTTEGKARMMEAARNRRALSDEQVREVRQLLVDKGFELSYRDYAEIAIAYKCGWQVIYNIAAGKTYQDVE